MNDTVFLIDDDASFLSVMKRRLELKGHYKVHAFTSGSEALKSELEHNIHAIILDMMLVTESGLDAIEPLKARFAPTHFMMLTGYASIATTVEAMRRGATDYMSKPVSLGELLLRLQGNHPPASETTKPMTPSQIEWEHIQRILTDNRGNISKTARELGMHRRTLQRKLAKRSPY
ncbi:response regulator transcription factor [Idiomarina aminovorans]|uniref:response regulator transcription factor n=1 Tax=Idiomarina aminovorans TaxID=2914829 RepID=UPI002005BA61|nr:response regulator [Idiomarina sp. ATCH4]MCK7460393.1 response regulator [Idiomarina sp. ATCH4]